MSTTSNYTPTTGDAPSTNGFHPSTEAALSLPALPDSVLRPGRVRLRTWTRRLAALAVVGALVAAALVVVDRRGSADGSMLQTATTGPAEIASTYTAVATIEPVDQATVAFPTSAV